MAIAATIWEREQAAAKERMLTGQPSGNFAKDSGRASDAAAAHVGMPGKTLEKARAVTELTA